MTIREKVRKNLEWIILATVAAAGTVGLIANNYLGKNHSPNPGQDSKPAVKSVSGYGADPNENVYSEKIRGVVLAENPKEIRDQLNEDDYVIKVRDRVGRIRYLAILDGPNKTKQKLNEEVKPRYTIEFPANAIGDEDTFYTGRDRMDYTRQGRKYADRIRIVSKWTSLPEGHLKKYPERHIRIRHADIKNRLSN